MFLRPVDENNKMSLIVSEFASIFETISVFLNENQYQESFPILSNIIQKMSFIKDVYGSSIEFPDLDITFSNNLTTIKETFNALASKEPFNYADFHQYILLYQDVVTSQYLKVAILGLYETPTSKAQSFLSPEEMREKLSTAILSLQSFFYNIHHDSIILNKILHGLEVLLNAADNKLAKYFINLSDIFDQTISIEVLSAPTKKAVTEAMIIQLNKLTTEFKVSIPEMTVQEQPKQPEVHVQNYFEYKENIPKENIPQQQILIDDSSHSEARITKKHKLDDISHDEEKFTDAKSIFFELLAYCGRHNMLSQEKIVKLMIAIDNIIIISRHTPQYFINIPQAMLDSAKAIERQMEESFLSASWISIAKEIEKFYQQMMQRCFQLQICDAYNILQDNSYLDAQWNNGLPLILVIKTLEDIQSRMESENDKNKIEDVIQGFKTIEYALKLEHKGHLYQLAKNCIINLNELFKKTPEITQLYPQFVLEIIDTIKKFQVKLSRIVDKSFDEIKENLSNEEKALFLEQLGKMEITYTVKTAMERHSNKEFRAREIASKLFPNLMTSTPLSEKVNFEGNRVIFTQERPQSNLSHFLNPTPTHFYASPLSLFQPMNLEYIAKTKGFDCIEVPAGDLYSVIAFHIQNLYPDLHGNKELSTLAADLRLSTHAELEKNPDAYEHYELNEMVEDNNKDSHLRDYREIAALCHILKMRVVVLYDQKNLQSISFGRQDAADVICIGHEKQNNYQALIPLSLTDNAIERLINSSVPLYISDENVLQKDSSFSLSKK